MSAKPFKTFIILTLVSLNAFSLNPADIKACYDQASTTLAIRQCADQEYAYYDKILNKTYQSLLPLLSPNQKTQLIVAQKAWLDYRSKECSFMGLQHEGGTMQPIDELDCYTTLNKNRIQSLAKYIKSYSNNNQ